MNSGVSLDTFTFKKPLSIVLALTATLCAPKIHIIKFSKANAVRNLRPSSSIV